jgi:hypothetical protein
MFNKIKRKIWQLGKAFFTDFFRFHYSQFGEDIILSELLKKELSSGFYIDVGCYHPKKYSTIIRLICSSIHRKGGRFLLPLLYLWHKEKARGYLLENRLYLNDLIHPDRVYASCGVNQYP